VRDIELLLTGEPLALDLINTRPQTAGERVDLLSTSAGPHAWLVIQANALPSRLGTRYRRKPTTPSSTTYVSTRQPAVDRARQGQRPPAVSLRALEAAQRAAPALSPAQLERHRGQCHLASDGLTWRALSPRSWQSPRRTSWATQLPLPRYASARPRTAFCSSSRPIRAAAGARPSTSGNRARVARYYERHKTTPDTRSVDRPNRAGT
jgi:hypothetical protein